MALVGEDYRVCVGAHHLRGRWHPLGAGPFGDTHLPEGGRFAYGICRVVVVERELEQGAGAAAGVFRHYGCDVSPTPLFRLRQSRGRSHVDYTRVIAVPDIE